MCKLSSRSGCVQLGLRNLLFFKRKMALLVLVCILASPIARAAEAESSAKLETPLLKTPNKKTIKVTGKVLDEEGNEVIGASIRVKSNPSQGTTTGVDGTFKLEVPVGDKIIVSYVGYKSQELAPQAKMTIRLQPDSELLDDVVVVGYMPRKVANTSASVVKISSEKIANRPVANPLDAISGQVTGLQVFSSSGEPSAELKMALHGQGSLGAGSNILFIIDGMPVQPNTIRAMNPNDIESVQFLKDAAATSIYGARAGNGVIYITTKRGMSDRKATITIRGQYGVSSLANADYFEQLMTAEELKRYYVETGIYPAEVVNKLENGIFKGTDFKWYRYIYQNAPMYQADASVSGGSGKTNYFISLGGLDSKGLRLGSHYKKVFGRVNLNTELNQYVRLGLNTALSWDDVRISPFGGSNRVGGGLAALNAPFISPYDPTTGKELDHIPLINLNATAKHTIDSNPQSANNYILTTNANATITPIKNLIFRSTVGLEFSPALETIRVKPSFRKAYGNGQSLRSYSGGKSFTTTNTLSYLFNLGKHHVTTLIGQEYTSNVADRFEASGAGITNDRLLTLRSVTKDRKLNESQVAFAFLSFFGQLSYDYQERYFVDLVLRNDASSRFGDNKRNGLFYSVGLLWKAKNESFLKEVKDINTLDIKTSFGTQGNTAIQPYQTTSYAGNIGQKKGEIALGLTSFGSPDLSWERQSKFTVGVKGRFWGRLGVDLEYYYRLTRDMLYDVPTTFSSGLGVTGYDYPVHLENIGAYRNQGVDIRIDLEALRGKDYGLTGYFNFNYNKDKILELFDNRKAWYNPGTALGYIVGKPVTFVLPLYKGINPDTGTPEWYLPGEDISTPVRDDSKVTTEYNLTLEQNTNIPAYTPMTGGGGLYANWKGFYLNADFYFVLGKHVLSQDRIQYEQDAHIRNKHANMNGSRKLFDYWKKPGDHAEFPSLKWIREKGTNRLSNYLDSHILEDASFMRLKNLTIGYHIPRATLEKIGMVSSAKIYFAGRNLLTFTKFRGIDPEVYGHSSQGIYPNTKQLSVGVEVSF